MKTKEEYSLLAEKLLANTYKPHQLLQEELIEAFVVRLKVFERLYRDISTTERTSFGPHYLIEGQRGMGKTTLLLRLCYELERDKSLPAWLMPLALKEEQYYSITRLSDLWQRIVEVLVDSYPEFEPLENDLEQYVYLEDDKEVEKKYFDLLIEGLRKKDKKLVLFMDNMGVTFERFNEYEQQRLRQIMQTYSEIQFIGASHKIWDNYANYSKPFYDFFKVEKLKALTSEEINTLLQKLAEGNEKLERIMRTQRTRVEVMRTLTGGNIRTTLLVFQALAQDEDGQALQDLEFLLNEVTPYYKARLDDLTPIEQNVINALATNWGSMTLTEVSKKLRRAEAEVEKELERLSQTIWLDKFQETDTNLLYRLSERFFNIWYLMRMSRTKDRNRVEWFVKMLEVWFEHNVEELNEKAQEHIKNLENPDYIPSSAYTMSQALLHTGLIKWDIQEQLVEVTKKFLDSKNKQLAGELAESDYQIMKEVSSKLDYINKQKGVQKKEVFDIGEECLKGLNKIKNKNDYNGHFWYLKSIVCSTLERENESMLCIEKALDFPHERAYLDFSSFLLSNEKFKEAKGLIYRYKKIENTKEIMIVRLYIILLVTCFLRNKFSDFVNNFNELSEIHLDFGLIDEYELKPLEFLFFQVASVPLFYIPSKKILHIERTEFILLEYNKIKNDFNSYCILAIFYLNLKIDKSKYTYFLDKVNNFKTKNEVNNVFKITLNTIYKLWNGDSVVYGKETINKIKFNADIQNAPSLDLIINKLFAKMLKLAIAKKSSYMKMFPSLPEFMLSNSESELGLCLLIAPYYALTDSPKIYDFLSVVPPHQLKDVERIMAEIEQMRIDYA